MSRLLKTALIIFLAIYGFSGCKQPIGNLSGSGGGEGNGYDDFWIFSLKTYYTNDTNQSILYRNSTHVKIIGDTVDIDDERLLIEIMTDPLFIGPSVNEIINPKGNFKFTMPGNYILKGTYNGKTDEHYFEVYGSPVESGEGSTAVGLQWLP